MTCRNLPDSEYTPSLVSGIGYFLPGKKLEDGSYTECRRDEHGQDEEQRPDEDEPAVIGHPSDREPPDDHSKGRVDEVNQAIGRLIRRDHEVAAHASKVGERRQ